MAIPIKNEEQINKMRQAGNILAETFKLIEKHIVPGMTTGELDKIAEKFIEANGAKASFKNYNGFPKAVCVAVNEEVIHGIPGLRKLHSGDIIGIDIGVYKGGFHADAARTFPVGEVDESLLKLIEVTKQSFFEGIKYAKKGCHLHQISAAIEDYVKSFGYSVVRDYVGHGVGRKLHESPQVPHYRVQSRGPRLESGMVIAIEPMVNMGTFEVDLLDDDWTVVTADRKYSAHYENTVLITEAEPELLTINETQAGSI